MERELGTFVVGARTTIGGGGGVEWRTYLSISVWQFFLELAETAREEELKGDDDHQQQQQQPTNRAKRRDSALVAGIFTPILEEYEKCAHEITSLMATILQREVVTSLRAYTQRRNWSGSGGGDDEDDGDKRDDDKLAHEHLPLSVELLPTLATLHQRFGELQVPPGVYRQLVAEVFVGEVDRTLHRMVLSASFSARGAKRWRHDVELGLGRNFLLVQAGALGMREAEAAAAEQQENTTATTMLLRYYLPRYVPNPPPVRPSVIRSSSGRTWDCCCLLTEEPAPIEDGDIARLVRTLSLAEAKEVLDRRVL